MLFVEIIGNLGSDPEQRYTADGKSQVSIRVAVNSRRKDANGDQVERTDWFRARMSGGRGDYVARELRKGSRVLVRGRLEIGEYTVKNTGEVRTSYDIWADDIVNLAPRDSGQSGAPDWAQGAKAAALTGASSQPTAQQAAGRPAAVGEVDELPF